MPTSKRSTIRLVLLALLVPAAALACQISGTSTPSPLVGIWHETAQLSCGLGQIDPPVPIGELEFESNGTFAVTWHPFEQYYDYWGDYTVDFETGAITLEITGSNDLPAGFDGVGEVRIDPDGKLVLTGVWLGTPSYEVFSAQCGHVFE